MIDQTRGAAILRGARGGEPADIGALAQAIARLSVFAHANSDTISAIDINPLIVVPEGQGVMAVDALFIQQSDETSH
jgi:succinyl-CoA synthetase beta subunit